MGVVNGMPKYLPIQLIVPRLGMQLCKRFEKRKDDRICFKVLEERRPAKLWDLVWTDTVVTLSTTRIAEYLGTLSCISKSMNGFKMYSVLLSIPWFPALTPERELLIYT